MNSSSPELTIVMPAYNEEECIEGVVEKWLDLLNELSRAPHDINSSVFIVVNDGSKDNTGQLLDKLASSEPRLIVVHKENGGHGDALLTGYRKALSLKSKWVFHVDSDDQFIPSDFFKLWEKRESSKFILGYRVKRHDAFHRLIITRILRCLNLLLFGRYLLDANVPYRLIKGAYLEKLLTVIPSTVFAPNIFLSVLASRDGQDLMFIPVHHEDRETGEVSIVRLKLLKVCMRSAGELYEFRSGLKQNLKKLQDDKA